ncbi:hypothetical protein SCP_1701710 [Sparassis crispa]|uniref:Uncharacterized protein n=1 Tax=Sparassis crispa TaxID=139825 RepID=A0A401H5Y0_9APHY|nr:hypothetical protein SCP_1701710 [Sparassis crispa]GBE89846.1 hypothetical protein SCP_1701710 [Sparassis crispa]
MILGALRDFISPAADRLPRIVAMRLQDVVSRYPQCGHDADEAELLSKELRALHLLREHTQHSVEFVESPDSFDVAAKSGTPDKGSAFDTKENSKFESIKILYRAPYPG